MRILVAIANYGDGNRAYVERLIDEYRRMSFDVDIVILSDRDKRFGDDVEVRVGLPTSDPWSLPFAHKRLFAERAVNYDLFIYSEDDTLITERHIRAFLDATAAVPHPRIVGFMRYEEAPNGERSSSTVHSHFRWKPDSVERINGYTLAEFTNAHAAAFILTQQQLRYAIDSGGFLVEPHSEHYDLPCTAATDPYTQCGMRKVIPISHLDEFLIHHMPNKYLGKLGIPLSELHAQVETLCTTGTVPAQQLFPTDKRLDHSRYDRSYHESANVQLSALLPQSGSVLSVGCGYGALEASFLERGLRVAAIPLDNVIAGSARSRGVEILSFAAHPLDHQCFTSALNGRRFDAIVLSNVLQHVTNPPELLLRLSGVLSESGVILGVVPNFARIRRRGEWRSLRRQGYAQTLLHPTSAHEVRRWLRRAGLQGQVSHDVTARRRHLSRLGLGLLDSLLADDVVFTAGRQNNPRRRDEKQPRA